MVKILEKEVGTVGYGLMGMLNRSHPIPPMPPITLLWSIRLKNFS
jgi:hypothetical protein